MLMRRAVVMAIGLAGLITAADEGTKEVGPPQTQRLDFPAGGVLRVSKSFGELAIRGWDQPGVEVTVTKSAAEDFEPRERQKVARALNRVSVKTERRGNEVVIATSIADRRAFPPPSPLKGHTKAVLTYEIKVPRNARLIVDHGPGEVHVEEVSGDIHATVLNGAITLRLPQGGQYAIDAKTDLGRVISDFPGKEHRRPWLLGSRFAGESGQAPHRLFLRTGYGDIIVLKIRKPAAPPPLKN